MLAGADRVEGTLFGNGERTGNLDIVTVALNMFTQGVDPMLDFSHIDHVREIYERCTKMHRARALAVAGKLAFTAFPARIRTPSTRGMNTCETKTPVLEIPHLPIDPPMSAANTNRSSASTANPAKAARRSSWITVTATTCPRRCIRNLARLYRQRQNRRELTANEVTWLFHREFLNISEPYALSRAKFYEEAIAGSAQTSPISPACSACAASSCSLSPAETARSTLFLMRWGRHRGAILHLLFRARHFDGLRFVGRSLHRAARMGGRRIFGVGTEHNINFASVKGILSATNRLRAAWRNFRKHTQRSPP